jgi:hypothetical protein
MPTTVERAVPALNLVDLVDFKWLMAGEGHHIDVGRLQNDVPYARGCLALAGGSTSAVMRRVASQLGRALRLGLPGAAATAPPVPGSGLQATPGP